MRCKMRNPLSEWLYQQRYLGIEIAIFFLQKMLPISSMSLGDKVNSIKPTLLSIDKIIKIK